MLIFVLPNLPLTAAIEAGCAAIVPASDARLKAAIEDDAAAHALCSKFTDQFGEPISPAGLLVDRSAPQRVLTHEALAAFRNVAAIASLITAWRNSASGFSVPGTFFSDSFDFYPYAPTKDSRLMGRSVALSMRYEAPDEFRGQQAAHMLRPDAIFAVDPDEVTFARCMHAWRQRYVAGRSSWRGRALFRSLEMAAQATRTPAVGTREPSIHDFGTSLALWVSAFEILKPTRGAYSSLGSVMDLLGQWPWHSASLRARRYVVRLKKNQTVRANFVQKAYSELYRARCHFLHGEPVTAGKLFSGGKRGRPGLISVAPFLYRTALRVYVPAPSMQRRDPAQRLLLAVDENQFEDALLRLQGREESNP